MATSMADDCGGEGENAAASVFAERIRSLEETELRDQDETKEEVYKLLMVLYMIEDEPLKAKFLWKRIPKSIKSAAESTELGRLWSLSQHLIQRNYGLALGLASQHREPWSSAEIGELVGRLVELSKSRLLELVNLAYSSISVQELAQQLAMSVDETTAACLQRGWTLDGAYLIPRKKDTMEINKIPNQLQMQQLTSLVSFLET